MKVQDYATKNSNVAGSSPAPGEDGPVITLDHYHTLLNEYRMLEASHLTMLEEYCEVYKRSQSLLDWVTQLLKRELDGDLDQMDGSEWYKWFTLMLCPSASQLVDPLEVAADRFSDGPKHDNYDPDRVLT
jgi:hypothetical protein